MTYDDLLDKINLLGHTSSWAALRSVVIRHKVKIDMNGYGACEECSRTAYYNVPWPCQTIQDIENEIL